MLVLVLLLGFHNPNHTNVKDTKVIITDNIMYLSSFLEEKVEPVQDTEKFVEFNDIKAVEDDLDQFQQTLDVYKGTREQFKALEALVEKTQNDLGSIRATHIYLQERYVI